MLQKRKLRSCCGYVINLDFRSSFADESVATNAFPPLKRPTHPFTGGIMNVGHMSRRESLIVSTETENTGTPPGSYLCPQQLPPHPPTCHSHPRNPIPSRTPTTAPLPPTPQPPKVLRSHFRWLFSSLSGEVHFSHVKKKYFDLPFFLRYHLTTYTYNPVAQRSIYSAYEKQLPYIKNLNQRPYNQTCRIIF